MTIACQTVYVATMAGPDVTATNMTMIPPSPCIAGTCTFDIDVTWINQGGADAVGFIPTINVDGTGLTLPADTITPGQSKTYTFAGVTMTTKGTHTICPVPN